MGLTKCPDCGHAVSDLAPTCLSCGRPIAGKSGIPATARPVLIEKTSKKWKKMMLIGAGAIVAAIAMVGQAGPEASGANMMSGPIGALGFVLLIWGAVGAWWHHG